MLAQMDGPGSSPRISNLLSRDHLGVGVVAGLDRLVPGGAVQTLDVHACILSPAPRQLGQDAFVAERDGLELRLVLGDMADLSAFGDASFDLVVNPISTLFVPDVGKVWRECRRVLVNHGVLIAGFMNPDEFVFDPDALDERSEFVVRYPLPYVEYETLDAATLEARIAAGCVSVGHGHRALQH
jgi:SAM-dependent methyltransferase